MSKKIILLVVIVLVVIVIGIGMVLWSKKAPEKVLVRFDIKIETLTEEVNPEETVTVYVSIYNIFNETTEKVDAPITYSIKSVETEELILKEEKTVTIEGSKAIGFFKDFELPEEIELGSYSINASATFDKSYSWSTTTFDVVEAPSS